MGRSVIGKCIVNAYVQTYSQQCVCREAQWKERRETHSVRLGLWAGQKPVLPGMGRI